MCSKKFFGVEMLMDCSEETINHDIEQAPGGGKRIISVIEA